MTQQPCESNTMCLKADSYNKLWYHQCWECGICY